MKKKLKDEVIEILLNSDKPLSVETITNMSQITRHESRVNQVLIKLFAQDVVNSTDVGTKAVLHYYIED